MKQIVASSVYIQLIIFKAYTGERASEAIGDRLERPCYLNRVDHDRKIRSIYIIYIILYYYYY
jgi:hypothetical protein